MDTKLEVTLSEEQAKFVEERMAAEHVAQPADYLRKLVEAEQERSAIRAKKLAELKAAIQVGLDDIAAGRTSPFEPEKLKLEFRARMEKEKLANHAHP
jgi:Arc/MetJ-type ribon-helix-helix transcriptional regulator